MGNFIQSVQSVFKNAGRAIGNYPVVIASAVVFMLASIFSIQLESGLERQSYQLLLSSVWLASALSAIFGLAAITWARTRKGTAGAFNTANILSLGVGILVFILLYFLSGVRAATFYGPHTDNVILHPMAGYRTMAAIFISMMAFILFASYPDEEKDFSGSLVMTLKAFSQAILYGLVMLAGAAAVAGSIQGLLYNDMPFRVYQYIAVISGFLAFTIFIGFFPDFRKGRDDADVEAARGKPRFLSVLLDYILVPIMLALTLVLILWAARTIMEGMNTSFPGLFSISAGYASTGLILHILVTHSETGMAKFYRKVFPVAVLFILAFEAWALILQIDRFGLRTIEYLFTLGWIVTLIAAVLLLLRQHKAHPWIVYVLSAATVIAVLPLAGFGDLPVVTQLSRLERLLESQDMLRDGKIVPASTMPPLEVREDISETVEYLVYVPYAEYPQWLDKEALKDQSFEQIMGFQSTLRQPGGPDKFEGLILYHTGMAVDVSGYEWSLPLGESGMVNPQVISFQGTKGLYEFQIESESNGSLRTRITLEGEILAETDFQGYFDRILEKYPLGTGEVMAPDLEDILWQGETEEVQVLFIMDRVQIYGSPDDLNYNIEFADVLIHEKP